MSTFKTIKEDIKQVDVDRLKIKNIVRSNGKFRLNEIYVRKFEAGVFINVENGKTKEGSQRHCCIFLSNEEKEALKEFLK